MPSTFVGLLIFLLLLAPGFVFRIVTERGTRPGRAVSPLRETAELSLASIVSDLGALIFLAGVRAIAPEHAPDVGALVRDGGAYIRDNYAYLAWWGVGLMGMACLLAALLGGLANRKSLMDGLRKRAPLKWLIPERSGVTFESGWWKMFFNPAHKTERKRVSCVLTDGSKIEGWLWSFNEESKETGDRELLLAAPLRYQDESGNIRHEAAGAVSVSARNVVVLQVKYLPSEFAP